MADKKGQVSFWRLVREQHGAIARAQLLALGFSSGTTTRRIAMGRLHRVFAGVYAVGRPELSQEGRWIAAVLACGADAALSGDSAAACFRVGEENGRIEVTVPAHAHPRCPGIVVRRRRRFDETMTAIHRGIPITNIVLTLVDFASNHRHNEVERAINQADKLDLINPDRLRLSLDDYRGWAGVTALRHLLDHQTFTLTDSELERLLLPIARRAGLDKPLTQVVVNGFRVDFYWPDLGLVVETDGLRYHRTPQQQTRDRARDQAYAAAGLTPLRFTRAQVRYDAGGVEQTLSAVAARLRAVPSTR